MSQYIPEVFRVVVDDGLSVTITYGGPSLSAVVEGSGVSVVAARVVIFSVVRIVVNGGGDVISSTVVGTVVV